MNMQNKQKKRRGRPRKDSLLSDNMTTVKKTGVGTGIYKAWDERTYHILEELCGKHYTQAEIEVTLDYDITTIKKRCLEHYRDEDGNPMTLKQVQDKYKSIGTARLKDYQWKSAEKNIQMQIWLGKQYLGQKENPEIRKEIDEMKNNIEDLKSILMNPLEDRDINNLQ